MSATLLFSVGKIQNTKARHLSLKSSKLSSLKLSSINEQNVGYPLPYVKIVRRENLKTKRFSSHVRRSGGIFSPKIIFRRGCTLKAI